MDFALDIIFLVGIGVASNFVYDWLKKKIGKE